MAEKQRPVPGDFYRRDPDKLYQIITVAQDVDDGGYKVVYQALTGEFPVYTEPMERFLAETNRVRPRKSAGTYEPGRQDQGMQTAGAQAPGMQASESMKTNGQESGDIREDIHQTLSEDPEEGTVNPRILEFLDASTNQEKLDILQKIRREIDDKLMDDLAMSMDLTLNGKDVQQKYKELQNCLLTYIKYESVRR